MINNPKFTPFLGLFKKEFILEKRQDIIAKKKGKAKGRGSLCLEGGKISSAWRGSISFIYSEIEPFSILYI